MNRIRTIAVAALLLPAVPQPGPSAERGDEGLPTLEQVLDRYVAAVGGRQALERLTTRVCRGRIVDDRPYRGPVETTPWEAHAMYPGKLLIVEHHEQGILRRGFDGSAGWVESVAGVAGNDSLGRDKLAWLLEPRNALKLDDYFPGMRVAGADEVDGHRVYVVDNERPRAHYALFFDADTGLLRRIGYYWTLEDYRDVDGVLFPFRISNSRKGGSTTYVFERVEHDVPLDESSFAWPGS